MTKTQYTKIISLTVGISVLFNILFGRYVIAKISTLPILNKFKILSPQAPIVINNRETIRVADSGDAITATNSVKSKISTIVLLNNNGSLQITGSAINITSDGVFLTSAQSFKQNESNYFVVLNDGRSAKIINKVVDFATGLVFIKADLNNVSVANIGNSKELNVAEKVLFVRNSLQNYLTKSILSSVSISEKDIQNQIFNSDFPSLSFAANASAELISGEVVVNTNGDVVGIWNGNKIISASNINLLMTLYYSGVDKISRPSFGFNYKIVTDTENKLTGLSKGALLTEVVGANAKTAGLLVGDIITKIDTKDINETSLIEEYLQKYKIGDKLTLTIIRKSVELQLSLITGELK